MTSHSNNNINSLTLIKQVLIMKIYRTILTAFTSLILLSSSISQAIEIELTIEGNGEVKAKETTETCTENCKLSSSLSVNTLMPLAETGWSFTGWTGQSCDSGNEVLWEEDSIQLSLARGGAKTIKTGDINNDSFDDFVTISLFDGLITTNISQGNGAFDKKTVDDDRKYPTALDLADYDDDGDLDLYVAEFSKGVLNIFLNDGQGQFTFLKDVKVSNIKPYSFKVLDKNNDGKKDILISSFQANIKEDLWVLVNSIEDAKTQWYINTGDDYIAEEVISDLASMTIDAYEKEGEIFVVAAEILNETVTHYHQGKGTVVDTGRGSYGTAFGDIDKDGNMDVLAAHYSPSKLNLMYGKGDGSFTNATLITTPDDGVTATSFGDYNNDGFVDIATSVFNEKVFFYFPTQSYKDCVISTDADIALTANFAEMTSSTPVVEPTPTTPAVTSSESSGGGSFSYILLMLGFIMSSKRYLQQRIEKYQQL